MISLARHCAAGDPLMPSDAQVTLLRLFKSYAGSFPPGRNACLQQRGHMTYYTQHA